MESTRKKNIRFQNLENLTEDEKRNIKDKEKERVKNFRACKHKNLSDAEIADKKLKNRTRMKIKRDEEKKKNEEKRRHRGCMFKKGYATA